MKQGSEIMGHIKRNWWIVLVCGLLGVALAFPLSAAETPEAWTATERVAVYPVPGTFVQDFKPAALISAANTPGVLRAAEASLGIEPGSLSGAFTAKSDSSDPSLVVFSLTAPTEAEALERLEVAMNATKERALSPYRYAVVTTNAQAEQFREFTASLEERLSELDELNSSATLAERAQLAQPQAMYNSQLLDYRSRLQGAERAAGYVDATVITVAEPSASRASNLRLQAGLLIQGLVAGLALAAVIVAVRIWRSRRAAARA